MKRTIIVSLFAFIFLAKANSQTIQDAKKFTNSEQYENASSIYKTLIQQNPNDANIYYYYAENLLLGDDQDSARIIFDKGQAIDKNNPLIKIGNAKILLNKISVKDAKLASQMDGSNHELQDRYEQAVNNVKEANRLIDEAVLNTKDINILIEAAEALINFSNKDLDKAKGLLVKAEAMDAKNIDVKLLFGDIYTELNNGTLAADYYNQALDLDKSSSRAIVSKGRLYKRSTNYDGAAREFKDAITIEPSYAPAHRELGETYIKLGKLTEAKEEYKKYLDLSKNNCRARIRYASFLFASKNYNEALTELNQAQQRCDSNNLILLRILSYSYYEIKDTIRALNAINRLIKLIPPDKRTAKDFEYYGKILILTDKDSLIEMGIEQLQKSVALDPTRSDLLTDMANAWSRLKQYPNAIKLLEQKIALGKDVKVMDYFNLGQSYYFNKQFVEADSAVKKANELSPTWARAWLYRAKVNANIDSTSEAGLAKPFYEKYLEVVLPDSLKPDFGARYNSGLIETYTYLAYYYLLKKDTVNAILYLKKKMMLPLEPEDKKIIQNAIDQLEGRGAKPKK